MMKMTKTVTEQNGFTWFCRWLPDLFRSHSRGYQCSLQVKIRSFEQSAVHSRCKMRVENWGWPFWYGVNPTVDTSVSKTSNDDGASMTINLYLNMYCGFSTGLPLWYGRTNSCLRGFELVVALGKLMLFFFAQLKHVTCIAEAKCC